MSHQVRLMACILAVAGVLAYSGCSDDLDDKPGTGPFPVDSGTPDSGTPDSGTPDGGSDAGTEFTSFVGDLILNQTNETGTPTTTEDKNFVDNEPANAFPASFFQ
jgi:hypothetical protein